MRALRSTALLGLLAAALGTLAACQPTPEKIATWKGTKHGPEKLREVVKDVKADPKLRALAAAALIEIGQGQEAARDLAAADPATRGRTVAELVPALTALLEEGMNPGSPTNARQRAAKDALFVAREDASPQDRAKIDQALIKWTTADLAARSTQGGESTEKILRAIGAPAAGALVPLVKPGPNLLPAAKLIGELGDPDIKKRAAAPLVAQAKASTGRVVPDEILMALGLVGSDESTEVLLDLAAHAGPETRKKALYALAQGRLSPGDRRALDGALGIAGDAKAPGEVREAAFGVLEKVGPAAIGACIGLFKDADTNVRFRALEAALKAGGPEAIGRVLGALPEDRPVTSEDLDSLVVHDLTGVGKAALPELVKAARATSTPAMGRIAALRALGRSGGAAEAGPVAQLASDGTAAKALKPASTVGDEAKKAAAAIAARR